jgi:ribosomal protein S18 acetylase RimI-like enzyme
MSIVFREYRKEDREKIQNILIDKKRLDKYTLKTLKFKIASFLGLYRPYIYLLEDEDNNAIIAMGVLINKVDYSFRRKEWWIEGINVAAGQRRLGFGTMLMKHLLAEHRRRGAKRILFNFEADNLVAYSFYRKLNLTPVGRVFTFIKEPFASVARSSFPTPLVTVKPKKQREIFLQTLIPTDNSPNNRLIGFYRKLLTLLRVLVTEVEEGMTTKGQVRSIAVIYFYFMARVEIILPDMLDAAEVEQIVGSEFSRFSLCALRKIIINVVCKGPNCDQRPYPQTLPNVCNIEDFVEFEVLQI